MVTNRSLPGNGARMATVVRKAAITAPTRYQRTTSRALCSESIQPVSQSAKTTR